MQARLRLSGVSSVENIQGYHQQTEDHSTVAAETLVCFPGRVSSTRHYGVSLQMHIKISMQRIMFFFAASHVCIRNHIYVVHSAYEDNPVPCNDSDGRKAESISRIPLSVAFVVPFRRKRTWPSGSCMATRVQFVRLCAQ